MRYYPTEFFGRGLDIGNVSNPKYYYKSTLINNMLSTAKPLRLKLVEEAWLDELITGGVIGPVLPNNQGVLCLYCSCPE